MIKARILKVSSLRSERAGKPGQLHHNLEIAYQQMAQEEAREAEALEWAEVTVEDAADETR
jgi:hypothetical protein